MTAKRKFPNPVYLLPALFFTGLWLFGETGIYNDSSQYIAMHIHREPLYPFFLWIFRRVLGDGSLYLEAARFFQNALAAFSVIWLMCCIRRHFGLKNVLTLLVGCILLAPHVITPLFSESRLVLSNGIVSEALGLPLFYLFAAKVLDMIFLRDKKEAAWALVLSLLLSLTRGQMMAAILAWLVFALFLAFSGKNGKRAAIAVLCTMLAFGGRTLLVKSYNYVFNRYFINNTFGSVGLLANVLYAADREDGERISDEKARAFFYMSYDLADEQGANYKDAPEGFLNRAAHLEKWNDTLKFDMIEQVWREYHDSIGFKEYIPENVESDRIAGQIMKDILPAVFGKWLYDYFALAAYGLIRSVAVVHPLLTWYALFAYLAVGGLAVFALRKDKGSKAAKLAGVSLLLTAANVFSTSLIIMCLSRYMIYTLPLFYISGVLLLREILQRPAGPACPHGARSRSENT